MATSTSSGAATSSRAQVLPEIHLLCMEERYSNAFTTAVNEHYPDLHNQTDITIHNCALNQLPSTLRFDAVVSPANSYARLDGAFDDALARVYSPREDYYWLTRKAQAVLYEQWKGFQVPGTCIVVPLLDEAGGDGARQMPWGTKFLLHCPTMRIPTNVRWDREVVYECVWSLLNVIYNHNEAGNSKIECVLMTPLTTGVGRVSAQRWAEQCVLAMKHFVEAVENPQTWGALEWDKILDDGAEVEGTWGDGDEYRAHFDG